MRDQEDHLPPKFKHVLLLCVVLGMAFSFVVFPQLVLVESWLIFAAVFVGLLVLSFFASAVEAAIPLCDGNDRVDQALDDREAFLVDALAKLEKSNGNKAARTPGGILANNKAMSKLGKQFYRLYVKRSALQGNRSREVYLGSLAAFSVFANAGLASFIPFALVSTEVQTGLSNIAIPDVPEISDWYFKNDEIDFSTFPMTTVDLTSERVFVFVVVSIPILLLGKILPKTMGQRFPMFFGYRCFWIAEIAKLLLAWIVQGVRQCLPK